MSGAAATMLSLRTSPSATWTCPATVRSALCIGRARTARPFDTSLAETGTARQGRSARPARDQRPCRPVPTR
ncbi:hypothetical protein Vse01_51380 [Micromonospora sediminimaris]|uniref:Uncharacterized protein n=1 Tax=Micromonospora sediminimaris TaxID=547162 RepID=A0A9W5XM28_9ACTN|nr:hypothetical protein Vse01_51380 [Micromonospora sediminimaris]